MLDEDQLHQLGSLHMHAQAAKNDRELKAQAEELLEEQKQLEKKLDTILADDIDE